jgi:hypothetical protein
MMTKRMTAPLVRATCYVQQCHVRVCYVQQCYVRVC